MSKIYDNNLRAIEEINSSFFSKLKENKESNPNIEFVGKTNFLIKQGAKELLAYYKDNEFDPVDRNIEKIELHDDECTLQIGIGNGYMLQKLLKKSGKKHLIILVEPIIQLLNFAFESYDYSKFIKNGNLIICSNKEELPGVLAFVESNRVVQLWHTVIENYTVFLPQYYGEITKTALDNINQIMCNTGTVMGAGSIIAENDVKNLPHIIKHRGIVEIKDIFKNKPAIVILSAPTVTKLLPQLIDKKVRDKVIIIAIAQMLRPLLAFGIKPDFICTVDYGPVNYEHFDNLFYVDDIPLVALNRSYSEILKDWNGPKLIVTGFNPANENTIVEMLNKKGQLEQGGSVGHMAIGLAIHLGCNPIIHIGFDCAYDQKVGLSHNTLGDAVGKINFREDGSLDWDVTDPNSPLKNENHKMGGVVYVPGYFGDPVPTNMGLASFITAMENIFKSYPKIQFINSCEGGAKKKYCVQMSLKKALKDYCKNKIDKNKLKKYLTYTDTWKQDIEEAKRRLKWEINLFEKEIEICGLALKPLKLMHGAKNNSLKKLLAENEKYAIEAQEIAKQSNILSLHIYKTSREIQRRDLKVNGKTNHLLKNKDDLEIRINRSKLILEAAKESSEKLKEIYENVLLDLNEKEIVVSFDVDDYKTKYSLKLCEIADLFSEREKPENLFNSWEKLLENGNWARPLLESEDMRETFLNAVGSEEYQKSNLIYFKALSMKDKCIKEGLLSADLTDMIEYNNYIDLSREAGLKKDFKKVLFYLKKAIKIPVNTKEALWGIATTYHHIGKIGKSLKIYEKLMKMLPENKRFIFEYGQVMLMKDIQKGMDILKKVMKETHDFDSFYIRLAELEFGMENYLEAKILCQKYLEVYPYSTDGGNLLIRIEERIKSDIIETVNK
jgi:hypothetical protein